MLKEAFILASILTVWSLCGTFCERVVAHPTHSEANKNHNDDKYYYEDSYDYYETEQPAAQEAQFDLSELVSAWKEYIKDKNPPTSEKAPPPRRKQRPRQQQQQRRRQQERRREQQRQEQEEDYYYEEYDEPVEPTEPEYQCPPRSESYRNPDPVQCDKYYECNIKGEETEELCPDGFAFDIKSENCDYPTKVNCTGRPELQTPQPSKNCPRANGFFAFPANESCQKFWDCRGGMSYLQVCPQGVIFDPHIDACTTPDQSDRPECAAGKFLGFECPTYDLEEELRFGNHDRLPHPLDCQKFFTCLRDGQPRLGACPRKKVFNHETGHCSDPKTVPGCETYWEEKLATEEDYPEYYQPAHPTEETSQNQPMFQVNRTMFVILSRLHTYPT